LEVVIPRKTKEDKRFILNLNIYRNTHHMTLNQAKALWKGIVADAVEYVGAIPLIPPPPYAFTYTVFPGSNRAFDLGNVLPIIQKFTDDALIELGIIPDDSYKVIREINYNFGGVDKNNPRAELFIESVGLI
jgi:hypothetical protein